MQNHELLTIVLTVVLTGFVTYLANLFAMKRFSSQEEVGKLRTAVEGAHRDVAEKYAQLIKYVHEELQKHTVGCHDRLSEQLTQLTQQGYSQLRRKTG